MTHCRVLALIVALVATPVFAQDGGTVTPTRRFGGCTTTGFLCAGPSASITLAGMTLKEGRFTTGIMPGAGYGVTFFANQWYATGVSAYASIRSTSDGAAGLFSIVGSFAEYLRFGVGMEVIGATSSNPYHATPMLLLGLGLDFGPTAR